MASLREFKFSELPQRTQFLLFGVLVAAAGYLFYSYLLSPRREALKVLDAEVHALTAEVQSGQMVEARLAQFRQEIALQRERLENLRQILPEEKETAEIIRRVQQLAVDSNLRIKSFTPQATIERDFYEDWPILISLEGDYDSLGTFFERIGRFTRIINVDNINMKALPQPAAKRTLAATCTATTFVYLEKQKTTM